MKTLNNLFQLVYEKLITNFKVLKLKLYFLENESLLQKAILENYLIFLCFIVILK